MLSRTMKVFISGTLIFGTYLSLIILDGDSSKGWRWKEFKDAQQMRRRHGPSKNFSEEQLNKHAVRKNFSEEQILKQYEVDGVQKNFSERHHKTLMEKNQSSHQNQKTQPTTKKRVLFIGPWWQAHFPNLEDANRICASCEFTENQSMRPQSDAIVFHGRALPPLVPKRLHPNEIYVFMLFEALSQKEDVNISKRISEYDGQFNLTMTYRRDSDIYVPYGQFIPNSVQERPNYDQSWAFATAAVSQNETYENTPFEVTPSLEGFENRKPVAWIVSRCTSRSNREKIVEELSKHLPLDIYGNCFNTSLKCSVNKTNAKSGIDCRLQISQKYKFYLSFESSLCRDYVTEKFFETAGSTNMIPVVYGHQKNYARFPSKTYINARDFRSTKDLAKYLTDLGENPQKWLEYFEWRKSYWVLTNRFVIAYCELCNKLWEIEKTGEKKTYHKIWDWWSHYKDTDGKLSESACELS